MKQKSEMIGPWRLTSYWCPIDETGVAQKYKANGILKWDYGIFDFIVWGGNGEVAGGMQDQEFASEDEALSAVHSWAVGTIESLRRKPTD